jgi:hypothetical protein
MDVFIALTESWLETNAATLRGHAEWPRATLAPRPAPVKARLDVRRITRS